jgi:hypothetical protein
MYIPPHRRGIQQQQPPPQPQVRNDVMDNHLVQALTQWVNGDCACAQRVILQRPSAVTYPNTFVIMWKNVNLTGVGVVEYVALDLHYEGDSIQQGQNLRALGGLWVKGQQGAHKPEQDGNLRGLLKAKVPAQSPDPSTLEKWGAY